MFSDTRATTVVSHPSRFSTSFVSVRRGKRDSDAASSQAVPIPTPEISIDGDRGVTGSRAKFDA